MELARKYFVYPSNLKPVFILLDEAFELVEKTVVDMKSKNNRIRQVTKQATEHVSH